MSLSHVNQLWRSLAKEFDLPCLTAVIHSIVMGSLEVTWLILPHIAEEIVTKAKALNSDTFYNEIVELKIDDVIIYSYNTGEVKKRLEHRQRRGEGLETHCVYCMYTYSHRRVSL